MKKFHFANESCIASFELASKVRDEFSLMLSTVSKQCPFIADFNFGNEKKHKELVLANTEEAEEGQSSNFWNKSDKLAKLNVRARCRGE